MTAAGAPTGPRNLVYQVAMPPKGAQPCVRDNFVEQSRVPSSIDSRIPPSDGGFSVLAVEHTHQSRNNQAAPSSHGHDHAVAVRAAHPCATRPRLPDGRRCRARGSSARLASARRSRPSAVRVVQLRAVRACKPTARQPSAHATRPASRRSKIRRECRARNLIVTAPCPRRHARAHDRRKQARLRGSRRPPPLLVTLRHRAAKILSM